MSVDEKVKLREREEDFLEEIELDPTAEPEPGPAERVARNLDAWYARQRKLIRNPRITAALVVACLTPLVAFVPNPWIAAAVATLLAVAVYWTCRRSQIHYRAKQDRQLIEALGNLVEGAHIGLPGDDELSRAFEESARGIEERLRAAIGEHELALGVVRQERDELAARLEKVEESLRARHRQFEEEKRGWAKQRVTIEEENQFLVRELETERAAREEDHERFDERLAKAAAELEALRAELEREREERESERTAHQEALAAERAGWERERSELRESLEGMRGELEAARGALDEERRAREEEAGAVREEHERLQREAGEASERHEAQRREWEAARETLEGEGARLGEEVESLLGRLGELEKRERRELEGLGEKLSALEGEIVAERRKLAERERAAGQAREEGERREAELREERDRLCEAVGAERERVQALEGERDRLLDATREEAADRLEFFDRVASHLRGPLQIASCLAEEGARSADEGGASLDGEKSQALCAHLRRLDHVLSQVLDLSRLQSPHWRATLTEVDVCRLVGQGVADFRREAEVGRVEVETDLPADLPRVRTDERLLRRSLHELLANSLRFSDEGSHVRVSARIEDDPGGVALLRLGVRDDGPGIAPADRERIFEPFVQAGTRPRFRELEAGSGLGLALVKGYVHLLGGRVRLASEPGSGSEFTLEVPLG